MAKRRRRKSGPPSQRIWPLGFMRGWYVQGSGFPFHIETTVPFQSKTSQIGGLPIPILDYQWVRVNTWISMFLVLLSIISICFLIHANFVQVITKSSPKSCPTVAECHPDSAEDILVTHGPPSGILDNVGRGIHAGCPELLKRVTRRGVAARHPWLLEVSLFFGGLGGL